VPAVLYGSETWTLEELGKSRITAPEMTFLRKTAEYTVWPQRNQDTEEHKTQPVLEKKSTIIDTNGCNMFAEWTGLDSLTLF
jgi:hypothetical protein